LTKITNAFIKNFLVNVTNVYYVYISDIYPFENHHRGHLPLVRVRLYKNQDSNQELLFRVTIVVAKVGSMVMVRILV